MGRAGQKVPQRNWDSGSRFVGLNPKNFFSVNIVDTLFL